MFRGQLLSKPWPPEAEPPAPIEMLESVEATDTELDARVHALEDAVRDLVEMHREQGNGAR